MGVHVFRHVTRAVPLAHDKVSLEMECGHVKVVQASSIGHYHYNLKAECMACNTRVTTRRKWAAFEWWTLWVFLIGALLYGVVGVLNSWLMDDEDIYIRLHYLVLAHFACAIAKVYGPSRLP